MATQVVTFSSAAGPATPPHGTNVWVDQFSSAAGSTRNAQIVRLGAPSTGSTALGGSTANPFAVKVENALGSSVAMPISGNSTAIISSASIIRAKLASGQSSVTLAGGNSTAIISSASIIRSKLAGGQSSVTISGGISTAVISSASIIRAKLAAGQSSVTIAGGQSSAV